MGKDSIVEIPEGSGNRYRYTYEEGSTKYLGPVGSAPDLGEEEFMSVTKGSERSMSWGQEAAGRVADYLIDEMEEKEHYEDMIESDEDTEGHIYLHAAELRKAADPHDMTYSGPNSMKKYREHARAAINYLEHDERLHWLGEESFDDAREHIYWSVMELRHDVLLGEYEELLRAIDLGIEAGIEENMEIWKQRLKDHNWVVKEDFQN